MLVGGRLIRRLPSIFCALTSAILVSIPAYSQSKVIYDGVQDIFRERASIAAQLVQPIARCVARRDTNHAAFHGCIDWHSAVHGTLGLIIYSRLTIDQKYESLIHEQLTEQKLRRERALLQNYPDFEMPYGRAWFLRLAMEYSQYSKSDLLLPMADEVSESLEAFIRKRRRDDLFEGAYDSVSWALLNLIDYAKTRHNKRLEDFAVQFARDALTRTGAGCNYRLEAGEFMSICLQRVWLASVVFGTADFEAWQKQFLATTGLPPPVMSPSSPHHTGLNFSRAWSLAVLMRNTKNVQYQKSFEKHFLAGYGRRSNWDGDYNSVAHWVAQFGMLALSLLGTDDHGKEAAAGVRRGP